MPFSEDQGGICFQLVNTLLISETQKLPQDLTGWKRWKPITPSLNRIDVNRVAAFYTNIE